MGAARAVDSRARIIPQENRHLIRIVIMGVPRKAPDRVGKHKNTNTVIMKTKLTKKSLVVGLSTIVAGVSLFVASSTASASMASSSGSGCTGPKEEHTQGGTYCTNRNSANCCDNSGCKCGGGFFDWIKDLF